MSDPLQYGFEASCQWCEDYPSRITQCGFCGKGERRPPVEYPLEYACAQALRDAADRLKEGTVLARRMEQFVTVTRGDGSKWEGIVGIDLPEGVITKELRYGD